MDHVMTGGGDRGVILESEKRRSLEIRRVEEGRGSERS